jgi:lipid A ethanolaminephosphotransferase
VGRIHVLSKRLKSQMNQRQERLIKPQHIATPWLRWLLHRPRLTIESLVLCLSLYFALVCNSSFLSATTANRDWADPQTWLFATALVLSLIAVHAMILGVVLSRWTARPILSLLVIATGFATFYMQRYGVYFDPSMLRNVIRTDLTEASELISWSMLAHVLAYSVVPVWWIWRVRIDHRPIVLTLVRRFIFVGCAVVLSVVAILAMFQDFSALMRNQKELRYLITPANLVYSTARVLSADTQAVARARTSVGLDAKMAASWAGKKPALVILVVGETLRAASWGMNGYERQTAPNMQALGALNFSNVTACGTNTETSLPCMFSAVGRRDYDESRIRSSESLLHVLSRAGFSVHWRDNQSGCKGVCDGLDEQRVDTATSPQLCSDGRCLDEVLLKDLESLTGNAQGSVVVVLHMLGNHGPAYYKRYPDSFKRFEPTCDTAELRKCDRESIVNAYDNAVLYTDHVLSQTVRFLKSQDNQFDTAMLYVSDHGESLGEKGLFLHGLPRAIAPSEQTQVPMVWWLSEGFTQSMGLKRDCLYETSTDALSHDNLFHSVLGMLQVTTNAYEPKLDITAGCRAQ